MSTETVTSEDFRSLPTPEQVRAHGDGGLWEADTGERYKLFDRPRDGAWWDVGGDKGLSFCSHGRAWTYDPCGPAGFRPLRAIDQPRPWAEIDAIVAGATATVQASEPVEPATATASTPAATPAAPTIVPPPGGKFQVGDVVTLHRFDSHEWFAGGNPYWMSCMAAYLNMPFKIDGIDDKRIVVEDWKWPVERVSFVSRPGATATAATPAAVEPEFREETRKLIQTAKHSPIQTAEPLTVLSMSPSALITRADSLGAEAQKQVADAAKAAVREALASWARPIDSVAGSTLDEYAVQIYDITRNPGESDAELRRRCAQKFDLLPPTKENTSMERTTPVGVTVGSSAASTTAPKTSLPGTLKQELKEDGIEILYRGTARTLNREAKDLVVKYLVSQLPAKKRKSAMSMFAAAFDTEAGTALCGALLSLLPHMAAYLGKPVGPKLTRLARECRREGGTDAVARIMSELMGMLKLLTELGERYLVNLPDEVKEVEASSSVSAGSLPSASPVVDFSAPPEIAKVGA